MYAHISSSEWKSAWGERPTRLHSSSRSAVLEMRALLWHTCAVPADDSSIDRQWKFGDVKGGAVQMEFGAQINQSEPEIHVPGLQAPVMKNQPSRSRGHCAKAAV